MKGHLLRPVQGLKEKDMSVLFDGLIDGSIHFFPLEDADHLKKKLSLEKFCTTVKDERILKNAIKQYFVEALKKPPQKWHYLEEKYSFTSEFLKDLSSKCRSWLEVAKLRNKKTEPLPDIATKAIKDRYDFVHGVKVIQTNDPWIVHRIDELIDIDPFRIPIPSLHITLGILDTTSFSDCVELSFRKFFNLIDVKTTSTHYCIVAFLSSSENLRCCFREVERLAGHVQTTIGFYKFNGGVDAQLQNCQFDTVLFIFVSKDDENPYPIGLMQEKGLQFIYDEIASPDPPVIKGRHDAHSKEKLLHRHQIMMSTPKYSMVKLSGGIVHPRAKCNEIWNHLVATLTGVYIFVV